MSSGKTALKINSTDRERKRERGCTNMERFLKIIDECEMK